MDGKRWISGLVAVCVASLGLAGCGTGEAPDAAAPAPVEAAEPPTAPAQPPAGDAARNDVAPVDTTQRALTTAAGAVPGSRPFDLEVESRGTQTVFDVKVAANGSEIEVLVDAGGAQVVGRRPADEPSDDIAKLDGAQIDAGQALDAAAGQEPDARFAELEIDTNDAGTVIWQVELVRPDGSDIELDVDAQSGTVIGTGQG